jgi:hypothetical protein
LQRLGTNASAGIHAPFKYLQQGTIEAAVSFAALFWPAIVEHGDLVIMAKFY